MFKIHKFSTKQLADDALELFNMNMPGVKFSIKDNSIYIETDKKDDAVLAIGFCQAFLAGVISGIEQLQDKYKLNKNPKDEKGETKTAMDAKLCKNNMSNKKNPIENIGSGI